MSIPHITFRHSLEEKLPIDIIDLEELRQRRHLNHDPQQPHRIAFSALIYIEQGRGQHFIDFSHWPFQAGCFIFLNRHQINAFDFSHKPKGKAMLFADAWIESIQASMKMPLFSPAYLNNHYSPVLQASKPLQQSFQRLLMEIQQQTEHANSNPLVVMFLFSALLLLIEKERSFLADTVLSQKENQLFARFVDLLEQQFSQTRNANDYAQQLHTTYKTLNRLCKKATGMTAKALIDRYTILEAKRRLSIEKVQIQTLAYDLGFDEVTNFTKYFKKHTQLSPSHFQKQ